MLDINAKIADTEKAKEDAIRDQRYEDAAKLRDAEKSLSRERDEIVKNWKKSLEDKARGVGEDDIYAVVSTWTAFRFRAWEKEESKKLLELEDRLRARVVGQEEATSVIAAPSDAPAPRLKIRNAR